MPKNELIEKEKNDEKDNEKSNGDGNDPGFIHDASGRLRQR